MGLYNTYMFMEDAVDTMAQGYKINFLRARVFDAPIYRGNTPAGYILSSGNDMAIWLMTQLGYNAGSTLDQRLIERSHEFGRPLEHNHNLSYTAGWYVNRLTGEVSHGGNNPSFSSYVILDTVNSVGIAVMANLNSAFVTEIAYNAMDIIGGRNIAPSAVADMNIEMDRLAVAIICIAAIIILLMVFFIIRLTVQIVKGKRSFVAPNIKGVVGICVSMAFLVALGIIAYGLPQMFLGVT